MIIKLILRFDLLKNRVSELTSLILIQESLLIKALSYQRRSFAFIIVVFEQAHTTL